MNSNFKLTALIAITVFWFAIILGWCMDLYKLVHCDFQAPYEAEVIYSVGAVTGLGAVIGYMDLGK